jgi:hypothetical protein
LESAENSAFLIPHVSFDETFCWGYISTFASFCKNGTFSDILEKEFLSNTYHTV